MDDPMVRSRLGRAYGTRPSGLSIPSEGPFPTLQNRVRQTEGSGECAANRGCQNPHSLLLASVV